MGQINIDLEPFKKMPGEAERLLESAKGSFETLKVKVPEAMKSLRETFERLTKR